MHIQIEVTTICNYHCFYCAGRDMVQEHMPLERFEDVISRLPGNGPHRISLQGEGEPTLHPHFWTMVERVTELGHTPYTITNGTRLKPDLIAKYFPRIGMSIDTLDPVEAERIKRYNLPKVLRNLEQLLEVYEPRRIVIHTVDYGQEIKPIEEYLEQRGITKHIIQPLQIKDDYASRYRDLVTPIDKPCTYSCGFVHAPIMRFYNLQGVEMPCCYIKDASKFTSTEDIKLSLTQKEVPAACSGCRELYERGSLSRVFLL